MKNKFTKAKILIFSKRLWRQRLVFCCGAIVVGIVSSYFAIAADKASEIFTDYIQPFRYVPLLVTPLLFALCGWLTKQYFPNARGSGIPQAIAARVVRDPESRRKLLGLKVITAKVFLTLIGLLAGAAIGREGPSVQVGAGIMLLFAALGGISSQRGVVLAGAAAGVAAAFNTPLAGIIFAIEEMARAFEQRNSSIILIAIVLSGAAAMSIMGNYDYFGYTDVSLQLYKNWKAIILIGIIGGLAGSIFARLILNGEPFLRKVFHKAGLTHPALFAGVCGLAVAIIGYSTNGLTYGSGYTLGHDLLHGNIQPQWWQMPAKMSATVFSAISGIPGGIFSPSLSVGASLGGFMTQFFPNAPMQGIIILAMVSYFAGVTQAPITSFVIVLEITGKATDAMPLIAAAVIAAGIGRVICPTSFYHSLAKIFIAQESKIKPDQVSVT